MINKNEVEIKAGILTRNLSLANQNISTTELVVAGHSMLAGPTREVVFTISFAEPNQKPKGLTSGQAAAIDPLVGKDPEHFSPGTNRPSAETIDTTGVAWVQPLQIEGKSWGSNFEVAITRLSRPSKTSQRLVIHTEAQTNSRLAGIQVNEVYEIYDGYPVIRKWLEVVNHSKHWVKLNHMVIDDLELSSAYRHTTLLTPGEMGAGPSVIGLGDETETLGVIAVSEIPSALRQTHPDGAMGYADDLFEWTLGPDEDFISEPVFYFAYAGEVTKTISALSRPLDRTIEGSYLEFLREQVGVAADKNTISAPLWCSWSNFGSQINDAIVREQARIAARCGFVTMQLDLGWQKDLAGTEPDAHKFPDLAATARYVHSLGLRFGLWVACYRATDSVDLEEMPEARSLPLIKRDGGFGLSFASPWKIFYADQLASVSKKYGVDYFKQDFTNIKFGDIAEGHESRTLRESYLRGLRGLLLAQDRLREDAPGVASEITHEIYWGTPGVPCDVAALKHSTTYHIPPNDYAGAGNNKQRVNEKWTYDPIKLQEQLIAGCFNARQRFYAHRGLPLYGLEYYGAQTVNFRGSLTPEVQDRQICSWLMGAPAVFAGDLASLTAENIKRYRQRFDLLARLEKDYDIYRHFQFSGVPPPTDTDWHWWGKLNKDGNGAVVVVRGKAGASQRAINIPWVSEGRNYRVSSRLKERSLGQFSGKQLQSGSIELELPALGQEILELRLTD